MKIAVVGATGRTGQHVVTQALERGHHVTALSRHPEKLEVNSVNLTLAAADVLDHAALTDGLTGCESVVSALGVGTSRSPTQVYSRGVASMLSAMALHRIRRLSVISAAPVGPRAQQPILQRRVLLPILDQFFGTTYADMRRMEAVLQGSDLDWTCLRPPRLVNSIGHGQYRVDVTGPLPRTRTLTFADLATALLDGLDRTDLYRRPAYIAN